MHQSIVDLYAAEKICYIQTPPVFSLLWYIGVGVVGGSWIPGRCRGFLVSVVQGWKIRHASLLYC